MNRFQPVPVLILSWILAVYALFAFSVYPHVYGRYASRIFPAPAASQPTVPEAEPVAQAAPEADAVVPSAAASPQARPSRARTLLENLGRTAAAFFIFFGAFLLGRRILLAFHFGDDLSNESVMAAALGLGTLSYLVLAMGSWGLLGRSWLWALLLVLFLPLVPDGIAAFRAWRDDWDETRGKIFSLPGILLLGVLGLFVMRAYIPDSFYDCLSYHLALPQNYLNEGRIFPLRHNFNSALPQSMEMLFTLGLGLGGSDALPLLMQAGVGALLVLFLLKARPEIRSSLPAFLWLACPLVLENLRFCKNDLLLCLWLTLSFFIALDWTEEQGEVAAVLSGIFAGFMCGTKYTGMTLTFLIALLWIWKTRQLGIKKAALHLALFSGAALALFLPWALKNTANLGNPLYPFLQNFFGFQYMTPENWKVFMDENHQYWASSWRARDFFRNIWHQTFRGHLYPSMNFVGPVWLAFLPAALFYGLRVLWVRISLLFILAIYVFSLSQTTLARYFLMPLLPVCALVVTASVENMPGGGFKKIFRFLLIAGVFLQAPGWIPALEQISYGRTALAGLSQEKERKLYSQGYYDAFQWMNANLPESGKILFLGETRSHRFQNKVVAPAVHNEHNLSVWVRNSDDAGALLFYLRAAGITHILYNRDEFVRLRNYPMFYWNADRRPVLEDFWRKHLEPVYESAPYVLYAVTDASRASEILPREIHDSFR